MNTQTLSGNLMSAASGEGTNDSPAETNISANRSESLVRISDIICSASFAGLIGLTVALLAGVKSETTATLLADLCGLLFLLAAASYRGSVRTWWAGLAPISFLLLLAPVAVAEAKGLVAGPGDILRAAFLPGLGFLGGCLLATFRDTLRRSREVAASIDDVRTRILMHALDLKRLGGEMTDAMDFVSRGEMSSRTNRTTAHTGWNSVEYSLDPHTIDANSLSQLDQKCLEEIVSVEMDHMSAEASNRPKIKLTLVRPREIPIPLAVKGSPEVLQMVLKGLFAQALDSLIGDEGVIRVSIRPGMSSVSISIEDNGRGLNEAFILKLQEKGVLSRSNGRWDLKNIRRAAEASGWRLEMQARLGVGARVMLELPRVDAFAYGARNQNRTRNQFQNRLLAEVETRGS